MQTFSTEVSESDTHYCSLKIICNYFEIYKWTTHLTAVDWGILFTASVMLKWELLPTTNFLQVLC